MKFTDDQWLTLSRLLDEALALQVSDRAAWLETLPSSLDGLRPTLRDLLSKDALGETDAFLKTLPKLASPLPGSGAANARLCEGAVVGPYRLCRELGRGGMGSVWLAERTDGVLKRPVALKLPHAGGYGSHLAERFARERDILAALSHPHIARLYDAGVADDGQPFLALEYVDGKPLGQYCDGHQLHLRQRIALFIQVMDAVQYAHARLVVHRDLKPSNILVDAEGNVHLLDFGIAKLVAEDDAPESDLTQAAGRLLTPDYASPEQIAGVPLTTATDVYSLGVILYELCTGERPYRLKRDSRGALEDAILEAEVARPSAACRDPAKAALRDVSLARLQKSLRGDLDTIVLKALKKKPAERYASVSAFVDDLGRYLANEPISARADSVTYRAAKFVRRHAAGVTAAVSMAILVAGLVGFYTAQLATERDRARLEAQKATKASELLTGLLTGADPYAYENKNLTVRGILDAGAERIAKELDGEPQLQAEMLTVIGRVYQRLGENDKAQPLLEKALALGQRVPGRESERVAQSLNDLGVLLRERGDLAAATPMLERAVAMRRRLLGSEHKDVAVSLVELARAYRDQGFEERAEPLLRESLAIRRKVLGEQDHETGVSKGDLAMLLWLRGDLVEAESLFRQSLETFRQVRGPEDPDVSAALNNLGLIIADKGDFAQAESLFRESLRIGRKTLGDKHPSVASKLNNLSNVLREQGKIEDAAAAIEEALAIARPILRSDHPRLAAYELTLARTCLARNDAARAEPALRDALAIRERVYRADDWRIGEVKGVLGQSLVLLTRYDEAEPLLLDARRLLKDEPGLQGREARAIPRRLVALYEAWGRPDQAAIYRVGGSPDEPSGNRRESSSTTAGAG